MEVADHAFLDGRLTLREPRRGHRSGTDAVLLAAASRVAEGQHFVDVGAGAGAVALAILARVEGATATLIEGDAEMAALARHNVEANGYGGRATVIAADLFDRATRARMCAPRVDVVVSNPPFYLSGTVREPEQRQRIRSHVLDRGDHGDWMRELLSLAGPKGRVVVIHRPEALPALLREVGDRAAVRLLGIHPRGGADARRILLQATIGRRDPLAIRAPLVLHDDVGDFTPEAEDLHRGRAWLDI